MCRSMSSHITYSLVISEDVLFFSSSFHCSHCMHLMARTIPYFTVRTILGRYLDGVHDCIDHVRLVGWVHASTVLD